ncbi:MAG: methionine ABC transporter ATP-binding protein [Lachnospiraceae bacterium]
MIKLEHISKTFKTGNEELHAVKDVSLSVAAGEIYGIIGFSGAGKSTLIRCINLLERPDRGKVTIDGTCLTDLPQKELYQARKKIGMIFQHFNLMKMRTVFGNIAYPLKGSGLTKKEIQLRVKELLKLVDMEDKEHAYPSQLSGGQKQRVAIARALANNPSVLLCDEATSALDPQTTHSILQLLKELNQRLGITIVLITHEMAVIKEICNQVAIMEQGKVVEEGDVFSIFSAPKETITRTFIQTTSTLSKIYELIETNSPVVDLNPDDFILRLTYIQKNISEPLISEVSRKFNINFNIIFSNIEIISDAPLGGLVAIVRGEPEQIQAAIKYLIDKNVGLEVIVDGTAAKSIA